jgi:hypothetical protein
MVPTTVCPTLNGCGPCASAVTSDTTVLRPEPVPVEEETHNVLRVPVEPTDPPPAPEKEEAPSTEAAPPQPGSEDA